MIYILQVIAQKLKVHRGLVTHDLSEMRQIKHPPEGGNFTWRVHRGLVTISVELTTPAESRPRLDILEA